MRTLPLTLFLLAAALLPACGKSDPAPPPPPAATAPAGPRIVSTVPAATLNLLLIGAADTLVGVTRFDVVTLPPDKRDLPVVGDYESIDYEQLVSLHPTALVIQMAESRISPRLRDLAASHHIQLVNLRFDHIDDIWTSVEALGQAAGKPDDARRAIDRAKFELQTIARQYGGTPLAPPATAPTAPAAPPRPKVVYLVSPEQMLLAGQNTFIGEMIALAGGDNVGAQAGPGFLAVSREALVMLAPDVLLVGAVDQIGAQSDDARLRPWRSLPVPAARAGRVYLVTDGNALMASVDLPRGVRMLAERIHQADAAPPPPAPAPAGAHP
jgi:iron complex transport system substrate-binding protein